MVIRVPFPEPDLSSDVATLLIERLAYYRDVVVTKAASLPDEELRRSRLPSGWTPIEMLWHLLHVERRWLVWGFLGRPVPDPWRDHDPEEPGRWVVPGGLTLADVETGLAEVAAETLAILTTTPLDAHAAVGGRFTEHPPSLASICLHVLQEYARHAGQLDVAVELSGGHVGE